TPVVLPHETRTRGIIQNDVDQPDEVLRDRILGAATARERVCDVPLVFWYQRPHLALPMLDSVVRRGAARKELERCQLPCRPLARILFSAADALQGGTHQHDEDSSALLGEARGRTSPGPALLSPPHQCVWPAGLDGVEVVLDFRPAFVAPRHGIELHLG